MSTKIRIEADIEDLRRIKATFDRGALPSKVTQVIINPEDKKRIEDAIAKEYEGYIVANTNYSTMAIAGIEFIESQAVPQGEAVTVRRDAILRKIESSLGVPRRPNWWANYRYTNPFNLMEDFENWFEWNRRVHFEGESTSWVTGEMTNWDEEIMRSGTMMRSPRFEPHINHLGIFHRQTPH